MVFVSESGGEGLELHFFHLSPNAWKNFNKEGPSAPKQTLNALERELDTFRFKGDMRVSCKTGLADMKA